MELTGTLAGAAEPWRWSGAVPAAAGPGADSPVAAASASNAAASAAPAPAPSPALARDPRRRPLRPRADRGPGDAPRRRRQRIVQVSALEGQIEAAGLRHRVVSRRTSLVAISEEPAVDPQAPCRRVRLAVELPEDVSAEGVGYGEGHAEMQHGADAQYAHEAMGCVAGNAEGGDTALDLLKRMLSTGALSEQAKRELLRPFLSHGNWPPAPHRRPHPARRRRQAPAGVRGAGRRDAGDARRRHADRPSRTGPTPRSVRRSQDRARFVETESTRPSTYGPGLTLRLALEGQDWKRHLAAGPLFVAWETADWLIILAIE